MVRVSVKGVKSLGGHFACLCRRFDFHEVRKKKFKREHSYMTSDVFWGFLTYLPTLIRYFTTQAYLVKSDEA